jgi:methylamine dehydrogenase accessory protein MauD
VFGIAGVAKSVNLAGSRKAIRDFGAPAWLAEPVGNLLPFVEIAVAALLLAGSLAWWGALAALVLLLAFIVAIALNLLHGRNPNCNCFGHIKPEPIGWATVVRNSTLACGAGVVVWAGPARSNTNAMAGLAAALDLRPTVLLVASMALVALSVQTFFLWHLFRQNGRLLLRMDDLERRLSGGQGSDGPQGLPIGELAPPFELPAISGAILGLQALRQRGTAILLLFTDPHCQPCTALLPTITQWQRDYADRVRIAVISRGDKDANRALVEPHGVKDVLLQRDHEVADAYRVVGTPAGVLIRGDGTIGASLALGQEAILNLLTTVDKEVLSTKTDMRGHLDAEGGVGLIYGTAGR